MGKEKLLKWEREREGEGEEFDGRKKEKGKREREREEGREKSRRWMEWKIIIAIMGGWMIYQLIQSEGEAQ